jgi:rhodanese-related sulfurtransferase
MKLALLLVVGCSSFVVAPPARGQFVLSAIEKTIRRQFEVPNLTWQDLQARLSSGDSARYLIFDTRPAEEYNVSHLPRAIQVDPQLPGDQFVEQFGDSLKNKNLVFYCSVGYRSSQFLQRAQKAVAGKGAISAFNLQGGIFRWYNEGNLVVDAHGPTDKVHPYDKIWGGLLNERKKAP